MQLTCTSSSSCAQSQCPISSLEWAAADSDFDLAGQTKSNLEWAFPDAEALGVSSEVKHSISSRAQQHVKSYLSKST